MGSEEEEIDYTSAEFQEFSKMVIQEMLDQYYEDPSQMDKSGLYVCTVAVGYYPNDPRKQVDLIHVMNMSLSLAEKEGHKLGYVPEDILMKLAIEHGVEDSFIQEIMAVKNKHGT